MSYMDRLVRVCKHCSKRWAWVSIPFQGACEYCRNERVSLFEMTASISLYTPKEFNNETCEIEGCTSEAKWGIWDYDTKSMRCGEHLGTIEASRFE